MEWYQGKGHDSRCVVVHALMDSSARQLTLCGDGGIIAKSFEEVQKMVADLTKDRILIGHAIHNDLKVRLKICICSE